MTGRILCNLSFLYNKKRHGRILFFHTYYLFLYSTEYTFFSIICVSCTYFPLKANCIHSIHAYHLYLILHQAEEGSQLHTGLSPEGRAAAVLPTNACNISCVYPTFQVVQAEIAQAAFPFCHKKDVLRT